MHDILDRLEDFQTLYTQIPAWYSSRATVSFVPFRYGIYLLSDLRITKLHVTGNIRQLFDMDGWNYHRHILDCCEFCVIFSFHDFWYTGLRRTSSEDHWRVWGEELSSGFEARLLTRAGTTSFYLWPEGPTPYSCKGSALVRIGRVYFVCLTPRVDDCETYSWIHLSRNQVYFGKGLLATLGTLS